MTRKRETGIRQEQIVQAALALVERHGLRHLNVAAVARRVGLVPSAIYRHFSGKEAVIDGVLRLVRDRLLDNVRAVREEAEAPLDQLRLLLGRHAGLVASHPGLPRVVFSEETYDGRPSRRRAMLAAIQAYLGEVADILSAGQAHGSVRRDLDPATGALLFLGLVQPAVVLSGMSGGTFDVVAHADRAWHLFVDAVGAG